MSRVVYDHRGEIATVAHRRYTRIIRTKPSLFGIDPAKNLDLDGGDAALTETEAIRGADRHINNPSTDEWSAVIDRDDFRFAVSLIDDAHLGAHRQSLVGRGRRDIAEPLATGGLGAAIGPDRIP